MPANGKIALLEEDRRYLAGKEGTGLAARLLEVVERHGMRARLVRAARAEELQKELAGRQERGELDEDFRREKLEELEFAPPADFPAPRSILVAAVPRPETAASFEFGNRRHDFVIPPTYSEYRQTTEEWVAWLGRLLADGGHRVAAAELPLKLLATRSGLARYGRNNISYVEGLGSYFELVAAFTTIACDEDGWRPSAALDRCATCRACLTQCPTQAIQGDRFLIDASRCLTFHNERDPRIPFPAWIDSSSHHSIVGCMKCQWICPENREVKGWRGREESFDAEETAAFLAGVDPSSLAADVRERLGHIDALRFVSRMPRNLSAALAAAEARAERRPQS